MDLTRLLKHKLRLFLISLILLCFTSICSAETLQGIVTYVYDGDTIMLQAGNHHYRIRLASIDAPELDQPYGVEAKRALSKLLLNQHVITTIGTTDKYRRYIGKIYINHTEANNYMLAKGLAWHYKHFDIFDEEFNLHMKLENSARDNKLGLWQEPRPTPPWVWRKKALHTLQPEAQKKYSLAIITKLHRKNKF